MGRKERVFIDEALLPGVKLNSSYVTEWNCLLSQKKLETWDASLQHRRCFSPTKWESGGSRPSSASNVSGLRRSRSAVSSRSNCKTVPTPKVVLWPGELPANKETTRGAIIQARRAWAQPMDNMTEEARQAASAAFVKQAKTVDTVKGLRRFYFEVPASVKKLSYSRAVELFRTFDVKKSGFLTRKDFFKLIQAVCRAERSITREESDAMFDDIDVDNSTEVSREEFLGWTFTTKHQDVSALRARLVFMQPARLKELFALADADGNGQIDSAEFQVLLSSILPEEEQMTHKSAAQLFDFMDVNRSGGIDFDELLSWVHPGRKPQACDKDDIYGKATNISLPLAAFKAGAMEVADKAEKELNEREPLHVKFTIGRHYSFIIADLIHQLKGLFKKGHAAFTTEVDEEASMTCTKVEALVGSGLVLWERCTMVAYMDDPFQDEKMAEEWIHNILAPKLQDIIGASGCRKLIPDADKEQEATEHQTLRLRKLLEAKRHKHLADRLDAEKRQRVATKRATGKAVKPDSRNMDDSAFGRFGELCGVTKVSDSQ